MARRNDVADMLDYLIKEVEQHNGHASHNTPPEKIEGARMLLADLLIPFPEPAFIEFNEDEPITSDESLRKLVTLFQRTLKRQEEARRERRVLDSAVRLYPYVSAVLPLDEAAAERFKAAAGTEVSETDVARSLRCVEIAFGMEAAIRQRLFLEDKPGIWTE